MFIMLMLQSITIQWSTSIPWWVSLLLSFGEVTRPTGSCSGYAWIISVWFAWSKLRHWLTIFFTDCPLNIFSLPEIYIVSSCLTTDSFRDSRVWRLYNMLSNFLILYIVLLLILWLPTSFFSFSRYSKTLCTIAIWSTKWSINHCWHSFLSRSILNVLAIYTKEYKWITFFHIKATLYICWVHGALLCGIALVQLFCSTACTGATILFSRFMKYCMQAIN